MTLRIASPGLSTAIQDLGRPGYFHLGIPIGGAMGRYALRAANLLVGIPEDAACLEAVFMAPAVAFTQDASVAMTGADLPARVDGVLQEPWTSFAVKAGRKRCFDFQKSGAKGYIAISGGIKGRAIKAGDELPVGAGRGQVGRSVPADLRRMPGKSGGAAGLAGSLLAPAD